MRQYRKQIAIGFLLSLLIYVLLLVVMDNSGQMNGYVIDQIRLFPIWLIGPMVMLQFAMIFFRFLEWQYFLGVIGARTKISLRDSFLVFMAGLAMSATPGKAGEFIKTVFLKIKADVPLGQSAPIVLAERMVDTWAVTLTMLIVMLIAGGQLALGAYHSLSVFIVVVTTLIFAVLLVGAQSIAFANFCLWIVARLPFFRRFYPMLQTYFESLRAIFRLRHLIPTTLMGLGVYMSSVMGFVLILWSFSIEPTWLIVAQSAFIVSMSSAISASSMVPNGAGVTEVSTVAMLMAIIAPAHPELTLLIATATALIQGFFHKWFRVLTGVAVALGYYDRLFTAEFQAELENTQHDRVIIPANNIMEPISVPVKINDRGE